MQWRARLRTVRMRWWPATLPRRLGQCLVVMMGLALGLTTSPVAAGTFGSIIVIGDSLSDTGNVFRATASLPGNAVPVSLPYFKGHFSNGPMWIGALAEALGLEVTPSLANGTNFAFGGAKTALDIGDLFQRDIGITIPSLRSQVTTFRLTTLFDPTLLHPTRFKKAPADALYVVWGGANDLREMVKEGTRGATPAQIASDVVGNIRAIIRELQDAGAVYFLVPNLPDLGRTPEFVALGPATVQLATELSTVFNAALEVMLQNLERTLPIQIARLDTFAHLDAAAANPQRFGLTNVTEACLIGDPFDGGTPCANPEGYIFWDAIGHPTTAVHALIADFAFMGLPPLVTSADAHNAEDSIRVSPPLQAQPVLHVRLATTNERVRLSQLTVLFAQQQGDATRVKTLKVTLLNDTNANGTPDAGEVVLATREAQGLVDTLTLDIIPSLDLLPNTVAHLLVTLDINSVTTLASTGAAAGLPGSRTTPAWPARYVALLSALGGIGMLSLRGRAARAPSPRRARAIVGLVGGLCLALTSCNTSVSSVSSLASNAAEKNAVTFTVSLPAGGLTALGDQSRPLAQPVAVIQGATIALAP